MNLPRRLALHFNEAGHNCRHVADIGMAEAQDIEIVSAARDAGEVILTHDLDYGGLLAFLGHSRPFVFIYRTRKLDAESLAAALLRIWERVDAPLKQGAVVTLDDAAVRVRRLPIDSNSRR